MSKSFDSCSPGLLGLVTTGQFLKFAKLTQTGSDVTKVTTVLLEGVVVTSWSLGSSTAAQAPSENVTFNFRKVCMTDTASGNNACYDTALTP